MAPPAGVPPTATDSAVSVASQTKYPDAPGTAGQLSTVRARPAASGRAVHSTVTGGRVGGGAGNGLAMLVARGSVGLDSSAGRTRSAARAETANSSTPAVAKDTDMTGTLIRYRRTWLPAAPAGGGPAGTPCCSISVTAAFWATVMAAGGEPGGGTTIDGVPASEKPMVSGSGVLACVETGWKPVTEDGGGPTGTNAPDSSIRSGDRSAQSQNTSAVSVQPAATGPVAGSTAGRSRETAPMPGGWTGRADSTCVRTAHGPHRPCTSSGATP